MCLMQCRIIHVARVANATGLGPHRASGNRNCQGLVSKHFVHGAMYAKIDYELGKTVVEPHVQAHNGC